MFDKVRISIIGVLGEGLLSWIILRRVEIQEMCVYVYSECLVEFSLV